MITDNNIENAKLRYYERGILKKEVRSYEVSLWTLQDEFITVLKWSNVEQKGRIQDGKITLNIDGTEDLSFSVPMYLYVTENGELVKKENPSWYSVNGRVIKGLHKIKVIFNKTAGSREEKLANGEKVFEFVITEVSENHEGDILTCDIQGKGLAFTELGKIGYKYNLSQSNFELVYKDWIEGGRVGAEPIQNLQYWCGEANLKEWPGISGIINSKQWYYYVDMDWSAFAGIFRSTHTVYEEPYTITWDPDTLQPLKVEQYREKARAVEVENSNLYNITQTIAEQFGVHCRYEYGYDDNYHIAYKVVVFYNNFSKENENILGFTYPYSAKSISRTSEATDVTTKLFIQAVDSGNELQGDISIMDSSANKTKEDYILNFDYLHKIKGITDEQYEAISIFERDIAKINNRLIPIQNELMAFEDKKTEINANITILENAIDIDQDQISYNAELMNAIDSVDGDQDGFVSLTTSNPAQCYLYESSTGTKYINLTTTKKGIDPESIHVYQTLSAGVYSNELTSFQLTYDENNNLLTIDKIIPTVANLSWIYLTYRYKPQLYYENILKSWQRKLADDEDKLDAAQEQLDTIEDLIEERTAERDDLIEEKKQLITDFEHMMGPALREGYWQPENYGDYGDIRHMTLTFPTEADNSLTTESSEDIVIDWDSQLFDEEEKLYYEVSVNQNHTYYPCIDMTQALEIQSMIDHIDEYSVIFNTNYNDNSADTSNIKYIRNFKIGSEALIRYVKSNDNIIPVLILVGAKNMTEDEISFMKEEGNPRLGIITVSVENNEIQTVISGEVTSLDSSWWIDIDQEEIVYPRIKFTTTNVKADSENLQLIYNSSLLTPYEDYSILTRLTEYGTDEHPDQHLEYYISLKPEVFWHYGSASTTENLDVYYIINDIATGIYLDSLKIAKENAYPKVQYRLEAQILNESLLKTLYNNLARIISINDNELKLSEEDSFGYISQIELDLDHPQNDIIEVQNYTSKFEDLFSSIVASTEAVQRNENAIAAAIGGNIGLSPAGLATSLLNNRNLINTFLNDYLTDSSIIEDMLTSAFDEAGTILGNAKAARNNLANLSVQNASILSGFSRQVAEQLSPRVTRGTIDQKPVDFQPGDIFIEIEQIPNTSPPQYRVANRYVATSSSLNSQDGYGFVKTYKGSLAQITGASLDIDAKAGTINLLARNSINIASGGDLYLGANEKVEIVGNTAVNIGGTQINLASSVENNTTHQSGITITAAQYDALGTTAVSKVDITPQQVSMIGSKIIMLTGTDAGATTAIKIDGTNDVNNPTEGIWIGSNKGIVLSSQAPSTTNNVTTYGSDVEINPSHILFGVSGTSSTGAVEITKDKIAMGVGGTDGIPEDITTTNGDAAGFLIKKDFIGMAVQIDSNTRNTFILDSNGIILTAKSIDANQNTQTSSVSVSGEGIVISSSGIFTINTDTFKIVSNATGTSEKLYVANNAVWSSATRGLRYSETNGLQVKGEISSSLIQIELQKESSTALCIFKGPNANNNIVNMGKIVVMNTTNQVLGIAIQGPAATGFRPSAIMLDTANLELYASQNIILNPRTAVFIGQKSYFQEDAFFQENAYFEKRAYFITAPYFYRDWSFPDTTRDNRQVDVTTRLYFRPRVRDMTFNRSRQVTGFKLDVQACIALSTPTYNGNTEYFYPSESGEPKNHWFTIGSYTYPVPSGSSGGTTSNITTSDPSDKPDTPTPTVPVYGGCFVAGTKIMLTNNTLIAIEDIKVGTKIRTYDEIREKLAEAEVAGTKAYKTISGIYSICLSSGKVLTLTGGHPVLTERGWAALNVEVANKEHPEIGDVLLLNKNDIIIGYKERFKITEIIPRKDLDGSIVYNIDVNPYHTYIAEGAVVHNGLQVNKSLT